MFNFVMNLFIVLGVSLLIFGIIKLSMFLIHSYPNLALLFIIFVICLVCMLIYEAVR